MFNRYDVLSLFTVYGDAQSNKSSKLTSTGRSNSELNVEQYYFAGSLQVFRALT